MPSGLVGVGGSFGPLDDGDVRLILILGGNAGDDPFGEFAQSDASLVSDHIICPPKELTRGVRRQISIQSRLSWRPPCGPRQGTKQVD